MKTIQFGVLKQDPGGLVPSLILVDHKVQSHLEQMFARSDPQQLGRAPEPFQLAEKYSDTQCATLALDDALAAEIKNLYEAANLLPDHTILAEPAKIKAYFSIVHDGKDKKLGIRQATQFKTLHNKPLMIFADGQLGLEERPLFKLDDRWDITTDGKVITILSATALERICDLSPQIRSSAIQSLGELAPSMPYLEMAPLQERVENFTRSARIVADLRKRGDLASVTSTRLQEVSTGIGVEYEVVDGKYIVRVGSEEGLLMLLDRRRYPDPLVVENPDIYEADSRRKVSKSV